MADVFVTVNNEGGADDIGDSLAEIIDRLERIERKLGTARRKEHDIMEDLTDIKAAIEENTSVDQSAIALLEDLADRLDAAQDDPAAIADLAASIRTSSADLAAAVAANTPSGPEAGAPTDAGADAGTGEDTGDGGVSGDGSEGVTA